jgi:hypothetical protein
MATDARQVAGGQPAIAYPVRKDTWWITPLLVVVTFGAFVIYAVFRFYEGFLGSATYYDLAEKGLPYLSPFYAIEVHKWFGWHITPALFVMPIPIAFRLTCYYFRKAGYRSFTADPISCAVPERRKGYKGETAWPFVAVNIHRITFWLAAALVLLTWYDTVFTFIFQGRFGVGVGSLLFLAEAIFVSLYTFSCHSFRHWIGGKKDCFTCGGGGADLQYGLWGVVSKFNLRHGLWFWCSLLSIVAVDLWVRLIGTGVLPVVCDRIF